MKNLIYLTILGGFIFYLVTGCELDKEKDKKDVVTGDVAVDVVQGITIKESCEKHRKALCHRLIACGTYASQSACNDWFNKNYAACEDLPTDKLSPEKEGYLNDCLNGLETADCTKLSKEGAEATVPACAKFLLN